MLVVAVLAAVCSPTREDEVPTLAVLPSVTPTEVITDTAEPTETEEPTETPLPSNTPTFTYTPTKTSTPTETLTPSRTPVPSDTPNATRAVVGTATAERIEAPQFSTFTPIAPGLAALARPTSTGTPQVMADVVITESQFQEEVTRILENNPRVSQSELRITGEGVRVNLTALGSEAFVTGNFLIRFDLSIGGFNNVLIARPVPPDEFIMQDGNPPSEEFITTAYSDVTEAVFEAFNDILNQRLGEGQHDLEYIVLESGRMGISLLVPDPGQ
jgi:hypothetical protein